MDIKGAWDGKLSTSRIELESAKVGLERLSIGTYLTWRHGYQN
jgi:hypothetical protein